MDTIDLDAIAEKIDGEGNYSTEEQFNKLCMKEAIHQALLLASEKAKLIHFFSFSASKAAVRLTRVETREGTTIIDKQSISDVEKLIK